MASGKCKTCYYSRPLSGSSSWGLFCDYIGYELTRRPCEGGEKCTVYKKKEAKKFEKVKGDEIWN
jgi:hypothetical protein